MNAIVAPRPHRADAGAVFRPTDLTALGLLIERFEALQYGPELDAEVFRTLGWQVAAPTSLRACWRVRSPLSRLWLPMPAISTSIDGAALLRLEHWDWSAGRRGAHGYAWVRDTRREARFFEATMGQPPQCLARCWLHAWRSILMENSP